MKKINKTNTQDNSQKETFKARFNKQLDKLGISQKAFSIDTGISQGAITKYKNGEILPNMEVIEKMAQRFNVSANYLLGKSDVPTFNCEDINKKIGLSQTAIETLYKIQHEYFELENNFEVNIEEKRKISKTYQEELHILSQIIESNIYLINLLHDIKSYKSKKQELQTLIKSYKETKDVKTYAEIMDIAKECKFFKFSAIETFSNMIEQIIKGEDKN